MPPVSVHSLVLRKVPSKPTLQKFDFIPAIVMLALSGFICFLFFVISGSFPFYYLLFPITMFIMPLIFQWRSNGDSKKSYAKVLKQYEEHLEKMDAEWKKQNNIVAKYYFDNYPEPSTIPESIVNSIAETGDKLWCVIREHQEFLSFRIGTYERPSPIGVQMPNEAFEDVPDSIKEKIYDIMSKNRLISDSPMIVDLKNNPFIAFKVLSVQKNMYHLNAALLGLFSTHAYDDVRLVVACKAGSEKSMGWLRWLPHIWNEQNDFRFFCSDDNKMDMFDRLEVLIKERSGNLGTNHIYPEYVLVIEDVATFFSHSLSSYFTSTNVQLGIKIIFVLGEQETIPSICSLVVDVNHKKVMEHKAQSEVAFVADGIDSKIAENIARVLSNVELVNGERRGRLPEIVTFFDLLKNDALRQSSIRSTWEHNQAHINGIGLNVPIGVKADGMPIYVDLKDGADGAHAIIAGMTGSGKTELLQTLILSLCVNYSPEQVSFAFVDFKEGGMAIQFKGIPHESGILTNQGNNVAYLANRAITMLQQEKKYRGDLLSDFGLDIDRYHKKYYSTDRDKMIPLPHLFVVIDESAEVVDQFREFMTEMVSLARVGRSMGIHLILSTQNPSRTIDSQIFDNANLKICLSVLSEEESKAILKTKDAAYIVTRGRAILMTGNGKRIEEFQSAYTGATATSSSENLGTGPIAIFPDGNIAQLVKKDSGDSGTTQILETLSVLRNMLSQRLEHKVFSSTLSNDLYLFDMDDSTLSDLKSVGFATVLGKADVLESQAIQDVVVGFDSCRNLVIYGTPRSGKTTLAETILIDIVQRYPQEKLQCIVVATGASSMSRLTGKTFVSEVITEGDPEKLYRLPMFLINETKRRLEIIKASNCITISDYETLSRVETLPRIVVFIDSLQHYQQASKLADVFASGSAQAGIHVVATYQDSALPRTLASYFGGQVVLQIHDDLSFKYNISYNGIIENNVGRGIFGDQSSKLLEIQAFQPSLTVANAHKTGTTSKEILKRSYNFDNGLLEFLSSEISIVRYSRKITIRTVSDIIEGLTSNDQGFPIGVFYESLEPFKITTKTKACIFSILGDKQTRLDLRYLLNENLRKIGNVLYYGDDKYVPEANIIKNDFEKETDDGRHLFILVYYETPEFNSTAPDNHKTIIDLLETTYRGKASLIIITSARMAKSYVPLNEYCINANCIVAVGGKHDAHVRFADVSTRIIDIPNGEAYVSTSSTRFERLILKKY